MQVIRAKTAGFCMGVSLALKKLDALIENQASTPTYGRVVTYGPIIHNPQVLEDYAKRGVVCVTDWHNIQAQDCVVIRAHGIPKDLEEQLVGIGAKIVDATCPKVKQAQLLIQKATAKGQHLFLYGERDHPEVVGLISYAKASYDVFSSLEELQDLEVPSDRLCVLAAQTTQNQDSFENIQEYLALKMKIKVLNTVCNATKQRQDEVVSLAKQVDAIVVVGGKNSGNTKRLADIAEKCGKKTLFIEVPERINFDFFEKNMRLALTAGASTPKSIIDSTEELLRSL